MRGHPYVIPAKTGIQSFRANALRALVSKALDPRLRGDDGHVVPAQAGTQGFPGREVAQ